MPRAKVLRTSTKFCTVLELTRIEGMAFGSFACAFHDTYNSPGVTADDVKKGRAVQCIVICCIREDIARLPTLLTGMDSSKARQPVIYNTRVFAIFSDLYTRRDVRYLEFGPRRNKSSVGSRDSVSPRRDGEPSSFLYNFSAILSSRIKLGCLRLFYSLPLAPIVARRVARKFMAGELLRPKNGAINGRHESSAFPTYRTLLRPLPLRRCLSPSTRLPSSAHFSSSTSSTSILLLLPRADASFNGISASRERAPTADIRFFEIHTRTYRHT